MVHTTECEEVKQLLTTSSAQIQHPDVVMLHYRSQAGLRLLTQVLRRGVALGVHFKAAIVLLLREEQNLPTAALPMISVFQSDRNPGLGKVATPW